jgi:hypothetical protein
MSPDPRQPKLRARADHAADVTIRHSAKAVDSVMSGTRGSRNYSRPGTPLVELICSLASRADLKIVTVQTEETRFEMKRNGGG